MLANPDQLREVLQKVLVRITVPSTKLTSEQWAVVAYLLGEAKDYADKCQEGQALYESFQKGT